MRLTDFDFELPDGLIARFPAAERRGSRLLVVDLGEDALSDRRFADLPATLGPGDLLVLNDTRVINARVVGRKESGGKVEALIERIIDSHAALAQVRASKSPKPGTALLFAGDCRAVVCGREDDLFVLDFSCPLEAYLDAHGEVPLPPYLERAAVAADAARYQTVYARRPGAVAAPTAGLHFDRPMLDQLRDAGVEHCFVTLHVGAGTFQALRHADVERNRLHRERVEVSEDACAAIRRARRRDGRVIAVGTTSVRALEAATRADGIRPFSGETDLFIRPGYRFRSVDALLTNFHLPRSSLLMLVAAFAGRERILRAYTHAVRQQYRFFSYGDAMLILPEAAAR